MSTAFGFGVGWGVAMVMATALAQVATVDAGKAYTHTWDTVSSVMAMHGKWSGTAPTGADVAFVAKNYPVATIGCSCTDLNASFTIEDSVLAVARRIKAVNPGIKLGMYWRSDFALEIADCSDFSAEWKAHASEWTLKDDSGKPVAGKAYFDYGNPAMASFFARVLLNVTTATLPSGDPVLDYVYIDGDPSESKTEEFQPGISPARSAALVNDVYATFGYIQQQFDAAGHGQIAVLNGVDTEWAAARHVASGAVGSMFDHWSILQYLNRTTGEFNKTMMDEAFQLATSDVVSNISLLIKGWPGPIVRQKDMYPPNIPTPKTPAELQQVAGDRFNSELALFLLVADANDFWIYSWFWGFYDYVPNEAESTVPSAFFPQAQCALGPPKGPYTRTSPTAWLYERHFEHASVFVDLGNRTASRVDFIDCTAA
jgi:hypothetical protein